jgi:selenocysteine lyase/cysteine desulfurase
MQHGVKEQAISKRPQGTTKSWRARQAINYLPDLGAEFGAPLEKDFPDFSGRRLHLKTAMANIRAHECPLAEGLVAGLMVIPGVTIKRVRYSESTLPAPS